MLIRPQKLFPSLLLVLLGCVLTSACGSDGSSSASETGGTAGIDQGGSSAVGGNGGAAAMGTPSGVWSMGYAAYDQLRRSTAPPSSLATV